MMAASLDRGAYAVLMRPDLNDGLVSLPASDSGVSALSVWASSSSVEDTRVNLASDATNKEGKTRDRKGVCGVAPVCGRGTYVPDCLCLGGLMP